jgi:hypothetical protein
MSFLDSRKCQSERDMTLSFVFFVFFYRLWCLEDYREPNANSLGPWSLEYSLGVLLIEKAVQKISYERASGIDDSRRGLFWSRSAAG